MDMSKLRRQLLPEKRQVSITMTTCVKLLKWSARSVVSVDELACFPIAHDYSAGIQRLMYSDCIGAPRKLNIAYTLLPSVVVTPSES